jgi:pilus assembly protein CpaF
MDGALIVEREVRELIRRRGLDPLHDRAGVIALVEDAIADYDERAVLGAVPPLLDPAGVHRSVLDAVVGFGPLQPYLDDPAVEEIWINSPTQVFIARGGQAELTTTMLSDQQVHDLVERMLMSSGRRLDLSSPFVDASLPGGERLHVAIPDVTRQSWAVNIRKYIVRADHLGDLVRLGTLSAQAAELLVAAVRVGLNVIVSGATQAGKTTTLNALLGAVPPRERVISCEEVFELRPAVRDWVGLQCRQPNLEGVGEIPLRRLVKEALRMRPDRLVVGEVREAEALDLLIALNAGVPAMATIHANSAREALVKLCTLPLLAGDNVSDRFVVPTVASAVDLVVHLAVDRLGRRRVAEILAVPGRAEGGVVEAAVLFAHDGDRLVRGEGFPPHLDRFAAHGVDVVGLLGRRD